MALSDAEKQKSFDKEIKELISSLTNRVSNLQKTAEESTQHNAQDDEGVKIVTLAGTNIGATMRGDMDEKPSGPQGMELGGTEELTTCVNSNFQAINNSIMMGGSYNTNDPGVHLDISEYVDHSGPEEMDRSGSEDMDHGGHHHRQHGRRTKKSERESSKSDHHNNGHCSE